jgi:NSS family neurotransmitter:Na+ symporter
MEQKRSSFTGKLGFIMAAAGSAVGLGNIWRFPYLAAKYGGGIFLLVYVILAVTFGFALMSAEIAIGRKTKQSPLLAYGTICKKFKILGLFACLVPIIIMPYYCVIGGWVLKYFVLYLTGFGVKAVEEGYFSGYIAGQSEPIIYLAIFLGVTTFIVFKGVNKGL